MAVDLFVKHVPDEVAGRLRKRADANHRSLQGELLAILQEAVLPPRAQSSTVREGAGPAHRARGSRVAPASESALIIRQAREGRTFSVAELHRYVSALGPGTPDKATTLIRQERSKR